jgi:hypothetical protein
MLAVAKINTDLHLRMYRTTYLPMRSVDEASSTSQILSFVAIQGALTFSVRVTINFIFASVPLIVNLEPTPSVVLAVLNDNARLEK